jgi:hypothetical protein
MAQAPPAGAMMSERADAGNATLGCVAAGW